MTGRRVMAITKAWACSRVAGMSEASYLADWLRPVGSMSAIRFWLCVVQYVTPLRSRIRVRAIVRQTAWNHPDLDR